jgi:hypothetical protein
MAAELVRMKVDVIVTEAFWRPVKPGMPPERFLL